jgi:RNA polymerase sigma-I factor
MRSIVHLRLIDSLRKKSTGHMQILHLDDDDEDSAGHTMLGDAVSIEIHRELERRNDLVFEIDSFKRELAEWDISMDALVAHSPKQARTKELCQKIINAVATDEDIMQVMWSRHYFHVKKISDLTKIPPKIIERARIYIIGALIIRSGDCYCLKQYVTT